MCSRPKTVLSVPSVLHAAVQHGTFWKAHWDDVSEVAENEVILVVVSFQCLVWERISSNSLRYRSIRGKGVQGKEHHAAFIAKRLLSFHSN